MVYSISCTTRAPRGSEQDGIDYHFVTDSTFADYVNDDRFLEHATVHGYRYGTLRDTVEHALRNGSSVIMDIDVQGAGQIRERIRRAAEEDLLKDCFLDIFVAPPSMDALRQRLEGRGEDTQEVIEKRIRNAAGEMMQADDFQHTVVNDDLNGAYEALSSVIGKHQHE